MKQIVFAMLLVLGFGSAALAASPKSMPPTNAAAKVEVLGVYSNIQLSTTAEDTHALGYKIELYKQGDLIFGLFFSAQGLDGDTPRGRLQDVRYEAAKGHLSFRAKLTLGLEITQETPPDGRPSRDLFEFEGTWKPTEVRGLLTKKDGYHPERPGKAETISLKLDTTATKSRRELTPSSFEEWSKEDLFFGPQW